MKVKAAVIFQDLVAGTHRQAGEEFDVSEVRYAELLQLGLVEETKKPAKAKKK